MGQPHDIPADRPKSNYQDNQDHLPPPITLANLQWPHKGTRDYSLTPDKFTYSKFALQVYLKYSNNLMSENKNIFATLARDTNEITSGGQVTGGNPYKYIVVLFSRESSCTHKKNKLLISFTSFLLSLHLHKGLEQLVHPIK